MLDYAIYRTDKNGDDVTDIEFSFVILDPDSIELTLTLKESNESSDILTVDFSSNIPTDLHGQILKNEIISGEMPSTRADDKYFKTEETTVLGAAGTTTLANSLSK
jgi:hypothetical protein